MERRAGGRPAIGVETLIEGTELERGFGPVAAFNPGSGVMVP